MDGLSENQHQLLKKLMSRGRKRKKKPPSRKFRNECKFCKKSFRKPSQCIRHERIHTGETPYKCDICDKKFNQKGSLEIHKRKHSSKKPYECSFCKMTFTQKGNMHTHVLRVHTRVQEKTNKCDRCSCAFKTAGSLRTHISKYHDKKAKAAEEEEPEEVTRPQSRTEKADESVKDEVKADAAEPSGGKENGDRALLPAGVTTTKEGTIMFNPEDLGIDLSYLQQPTVGEQREKSTEEATTLSPRAEMPTTDAKEDCYNAKVDDYVAKEEHHDSNEDRFDADEDRYDVKEECYGAEERYDAKEERYDASIKIYQELSSGINASEKSKKAAAGDCETLTNQCEFCSKSFRKPSDLVRHKRVHTGEKPYTCQLCSRSFSLKSTLVTHQRTHDKVSTTRLSCHLCPSTFSCKSALKTHLKNHMADKKKSIDGIEVSVPTENLNAALNTVSQMGIPLVGSTLKIQLDGSGLDGAVTDLRVDESLVEQLSLGENSIRLIIRDQEETENAPSSDVQQRSPTTPAPIPSEPEQGNKASKTCSFCSKAFKKPSQLQRHLRIHTGEKPFTCSLCRRGFNQKNSLQIHMKKHTGERPYVCPFCAFAFTQKCNLKVHVQRAHAVQAQKLVERTAAVAAAAAASPVADKEADD